MGEARQRETWLEASVEAGVHSTYNPSRYVSKWDQGDLMSIQYTELLLTAAQIAFTSCNCHRRPSQLVARDKPSLLRRSFKFSWELPARMHTLDET